MTLGLTLAFGIIWRSQHACCHNWHFLQAETPAVKSLAVNTNLRSLSATWNAFTMDSAHLSSTNPLSLLWKFILVNPRSEAFLEGSEGPWFPQGLHPGSGVLFSMAHPVLSCNGIRLFNDSVDPCVGGSWFLTPHGISLFGNVRSSHFLDWIRAE